MKIASTDGGMNQDITARIGKASATFNTLRHFQTSEAIFVWTKLHIYNKNVKSVILYASETLQTTKATEHSLQTFINRSLWYILSVLCGKTGSPIKKFGEATGLDSLYSQIKRIKWGLLGHTLRKPCSIVRYVLDGIRKGSEGGRPRNT